MKMPLIHQDDKHCVHSDVFVALLCLFLVAAIILIATFAGEPATASSPAFCLMLGALGQAARVKPTKLLRPYRFSINLSEHVADTCHLTPQAMGCLVRVMYHYWRHGPLKDQDLALARIVGLPLKEWLSVRPEIEPLFEIVEGQWLHSGLDQSITEALDAIVANKARTQKATVARLEKRAAENKAAAARDAERHVQRGDARDSFLTGSTPGALGFPAKKGVEFQAHELAMDVLAAERHLGLREAMAAPMPEALNTLKSPQNDDAKGQEKFQEGRKHG